MKVIIIDMDQFFELKMKCINEELDAVIVKNKLLKDEYLLTEGILVEGKILYLSSFELETHIETLLSERLEKKIDKIEQKLKKSKNSIKVNLDGIAIKTKKK